MAARVFNPLVMVDMYSDQLVDAIRDLYLLVFNEFRLSSCMIEDLIDELSSYSYRDVINPTPKFFWSEVKEVASFDATKEEGREGSREVW